MSEQKEFDYQALKMFITGPTEVSTDTKTVGMEPNFGHRDKESAKRFKPAFDNLKVMAGVGDDWHVVLFPGSGSHSMEASIRSLVGDDEKVLSVSCGAFGDLYHKMAVANGKNAEKLSFGPGREIDLNALEDHLIQIKPNVVTFTHNETSTGVMNDVEAVSKLIRQYGALPLVDGVSIFGGAPTGIADGEVAMYCTGTQKCLALDSGFGIGFVSDGALDKAKALKAKGNNAGYTCDLLGNLAKAENCQTLSTPNCSLANQLHYKTDKIVYDEGLENRFARHNEMRDITHKWIEKELPEGFELLPKPEFASPSVTAIRVPEGYSIEDLKAIKEIMRREGYLMDPGYGGMNKRLAKEGERLTMRVGHMGDISSVMLQEYLPKLKEALVQVKK